MKTEYVIACLSEEDVNVGWMQGLPQLRLPRTLPLASVPPLGPLHLMGAGSCAEVAHLEGLWEKGVAS